MGSWAFIPQTCSIVNHQTASKSSTCSMFSQLLAAGSVREVTAILAVGAGKSITYQGDFEILGYSGWKFRARVYGDDDNGELDPPREQDPEGLYGPRRLWL